MPATMNATELPPVSVLGLFAYLDTILIKNLREDMRADELPDEATRDAPWGSLERRVQDRIKSEFRLMHWDSPLRQALDLYRLYHENDMAHALTKAYRLYLRDADPVQALRADYSLKNHGVLCWQSWEDIKDVSSDGWLTSQFQGLMREGDRFARYSLPSQCGTLLLRGDRLVWSVVETYLNVRAVSPRWQAQHERFLAQGGTRGFLAGEFVWTPLPEDDALPLSAEPPFDDADL